MAPAMMQARVTGDAVHCGICSLRLAGHETVMRDHEVLDIICFDRGHWYWSKAASSWMRGTRRREVGGIHRLRPKPEGAAPRPAEPIWHDERAWWHAVSPIQITCPECGAEQVAEPLAR